MKRFSLNKKRASKVLALALVAALVVPNVPAQSSAAALVDKAEASSTAASYDDAYITTATFDDAEELTFLDQLQFSDEDETKQFDSATGGSFNSTDKKPVTGEDGQYVRETLSNAPTLVETVVGGVTGSAVKLKGDVVTIGTKYPSAAPTVLDEIQSAGDYYSGVEIENPFVALKDELYEEDDYKVENLYKTATAEDVSVDESQTEENTPLYALQRRTSKPEVKAGVTISFWAKVPSSNGNTADETSFFQFYNNTSLVYAEDDMAKVYIAELWESDQEQESPESLFYYNAVTGNAVAIGQDAQADYKVVSVSGTSFEAVDPATTGTGLVGKGTNAIHYVAEHGMFMLYNQDLVNEDAAIASADNKTRQVYIVGTISTSSAVTGATDIVVDSGKKTSGSQESIYYHLKKSGNAYVDPTENGNWMVGYGENKTARYGVGAVGHLSLTTQGDYSGWVTTLQFQRSAVNGVVTNPNNSNYMKAQGMQGNNSANITAEEVKYNAGDEEWHYYTVTLTDEWLQLYMDGEKVDYDRVWAGNAFNLGSGLYDLDGTNVIAGVSDFRKLGNEQMYTSGWMQGGYMFGETLMSFITNEETKLYVGSRDLKPTAEGTVIDEMSFYSKALSSDEVKELAEAAEKPVLVVEDDDNGEGGDNGDDEEDDGKILIETITFEEELDSIDVTSTEDTEIVFTEEEETVERPRLDADGNQTVKQIGNADGDAEGNVDALDALAILKYVAEIPVDIDMELANVNDDVDENGDAKVDALDALEILKVVAELREPFGTIAETFTSTDKKPQYENGEIVTTTIDLAPVEKEVDGRTVLELKGGPLTKYPSGAPDAVNTIQEAKSYSSGIAIENPFAKYRNKLYDASRFELDNLYATATERELSVDESVTEANTIWYEKQGRRSRPNADTGVTVSFWAKVPEDNAETNLIQFYNDTTIVNQSTDWAKVYVGYMYDKAQEEGFNNPDSLFYIGSGVDGTVVDVGSGSLADFQKLAGEEYDNTKTQTIKYIAEYGLFMCFNPEAAADSGAAFDTTAAATDDVPEPARTMAVYVLYSINATATAGSNEIVVAGAEDGTYYHLRKSGNIYNDLEQNANFTMGHGDNKTARTGQGAVGHIFVSTNGDYDAWTPTLAYQRDLGGGVCLTGTETQIGTTTTFQNNTSANFTAEDAKEQASDGQWHYYTVTMTDEWMQLFIDGEEVNYDRAWAGNAFNLGSGLYDLDGTNVVAGQTDLGKIGTDSIFTAGWMGGGYMFGESLMSFITDENTKLYFGGKTLTTATGTLLDDASFYIKALSRGEVQEEYEKAAALYE